MNYSMDESDFKKHVRKFLRQIKTKTAMSPQQSLNAPYCQGNVSVIMDLAF